MIKIEKTEKDYLRCQSCNHDSQLNNISIGLNLNRTSSFSLCGDCLSFFYNEINKVKIEKLQDHHKIMKEALEFYAEIKNYDHIEQYNNAFTVIDPVDCEKFVDKWHDVTFIGGKRAREALAKVNDKHSEG